MSQTHLRGVLVPAGPQGLAALRPACEAAWSGIGPAIAPIPTPGRIVSVTAAHRVTSALRPDEPLEFPDVVAVISTSGSTGDPKGVYWTRGALTAATSAFAKRFGTGTAVLALPLTSAAGAMALFRAVVSGNATEALKSLGGEQPFSVADFIDVTERAKRHSAPLHTSLIDEQLRRLLESTEGTRALASYDCVLVGGGPVGDSVVKARAAGIRIHTSYGMTETCGGCWYDNQALDGISITTSPEGRLVVTGDVVSPGYRFRADPNLKARTFITSDLGSINEGRLTITGRVDDAVKINGVLVDLAAVERITCQITGATNVVARVRDGLEVVLEAEEVNTQELVSAVRDQINARLVAVHMVAAESLPRLPGGKLDVQQVRG